MSGGVRHSDKERSHDGSITIGEINRRAATWADEQPLTVSCGLDGCGWSFEGPAAVARAASLDHRVAVHPEVADAARLLRKRQQETRTRTKAEKEAKYADEKAARKSEPLVSRPRLREVAAVRSGEAVRPATAPSREKNVGGRPPVWSVEKAVAAAVEHYASTGKLPTRQDCDRPNVLPSYVAVRRVFGGMPAYQAAALAALAEVASPHLGPVGAASSNAAPARRALQRLAAMRAELDEMERELLEALEDEAA